MSAGRLTCVFSIPVWFSRSRSMAHTFSSCVSRDVIGLSGRRHTTAMPTATVTSPTTRNMICQEVKVLAV